ncbi:MAG: hypothetical protein C4542_08090 [Dehalococcoidia bacterium]|nr:MAG: hypothetical protein C4542_08090 [Dehalococcoidia bacterium]
MATTEVADRKKVARNTKVKKLLEYTGMLNVADSLKEEELREIGVLVAEEYEIDKQSRVEWEAQMEQAEKLVRLLMQKKTWPWDGASNAIYPLLAQACVQFNSRSLPLMMKGQRAVKCRVNGPDPQGAKAKIASLVSEHMSWQLTDEMEDWIGEKDAMLLSLPAYGCAFQKVYRDIPNQRNVSEYYSPLDIVIHFKARSLSSAKRITHVFELSKREIVERQRAGLYLEDVELGHGDSEAKTGELREKEPSYVILEQHRWLDLDDDDLDEPYVVTIHKDSKKVLRIRPRFNEQGISITADEKRIAKIKPIQYFVRYLFMPAPDRNIYGWGFGQLLLHPNHILNSIINQTIDSGTWYNTTAGVVSHDIGIGQGTVSFAPHELKVSQNNFDDITKKIFMLPAREPSMVMYQVLGLLLESFERLGNSVDVLTGEHSTANQPASTTLALIEQGMKFYKAASGRLFKGLKDEFRLLFDLNAKHMSMTQEQFFRLFETEDRAISGMAYNTESLDVVPVGAAEEITVVEKLIKAEQGLAAAKEMGLPWQYMREHYRRYYDALNVEDIDAILPPPDWQPAPDPKAAAEQAKVDILAQDSKREDLRFGVELKKLPYELTKLKLELLEMKEDIKNKGMKEQVNAAVKITAAETNRKKVEADKAKAEAAAKKPAARKKESK